MYNIARIKKILSATAAVWFSGRNYVVNLFDQFENNEGQVIAQQSSDKLFVIFV